MAFKDALHGRQLAEIKAKEDAGRYQTAEILWEQLLKEEPDVDGYYLRFGFLYHKIKEYDKAIDVFEAGLQRIRSLQNCMRHLGFPIFPKRSQKTRARHLKKR